MLPETVVKRRSASGGTIYLIGTEHLSRDAPVRVRSLIEAVKPDTVAVELDAERAMVMAPSLFRRGGGGGDAPLVMALPPVEVAIGAKELALTLALRAPT
jgi:uncharacterized membrane protein YgcG